MPSSQYFQSMDGVIKIQTQDSEVSAIWNQADSPRGIMVLAHGAGAGMTHSWMEQLALSLTGEGLTTLRFNFLYIEQGRRSPPSPKKAQQTIQDVVNYAHNAYPELPIFVGGKSYGGRMASHCAAQKTIPATEGLVFFGFPLHAPGRDSKNRADHLAEVAVPMLFLQGTKDKLANIQMITEVVNDLSKATLQSFESADHSFKVPKALGIDQETMIKNLAQATRSWIDTL